MQLHNEALKFHVDFLFLVDAHVFVNIFIRENGLFKFRFRVFLYCKNWEIHLQNANLHIIGYRTYEDLLKQKKNGKQVKNISKLLMINIICKEIYIETIIKFKEYYI